jgi:hypothetical protein
MGEMNAVVMRNPYRILVGERERKILRRKDVKVGL